MVRNKAYFASDAHLGLDIKGDPKDAERRLVRWLDSIKEDAAYLFLLGDMFDYWFEYRHVVPKGFTRFLGKLGELSDLGVRLFIFAGNHDIWMFDYLPKEVGAEVLDGSCEMQIFGKRFFMAHGDGLGDPSWSFRFIRSFFRNKLCQRLYKGIHPWFTVPLGYAWSRHSRKAKLGKPESRYLGEEKEYMVRFSKEHALRSPGVDFYVFGHRHIMLDLPIGEGRRVVILGDWIDHFSYAVFDGETFELKRFEDAPPLE